MSALTLYHYWRSSCSWRVRWAFELKGIQPEYVPVDLLKGEQKSPEHRLKNPLGLVPTLEIRREGQSTYLSESMAILWWAEKTIPDPKIFPTDPIALAQVLQLCEIINSGTQPLQNLGVAKEAALRPDGTEDETKRTAWVKNWIERGLSSFESVSQKVAGSFAWGDSISAADLYLIPQVYNAKRNNIDVSIYPTITRIVKNAMATNACLASEPSRYEPSTQR